MNLWEDFKKFAFKGNAVDLAIGVVIGAAFGKIVSAIVAGLIMPIVALLMPAGDWRENGFILRQGPDPAKTVILKYGEVLGAVLDFFLIAFVLFFVVSRLVRAAEGRLKGPAAPDTKQCPLCLETIPLAAKRCKFCAADLPAVSIASR
jgi:large conductance mechanosensitive channel